MLLKLLLARKHLSSLENTVIKFITANQPYCILSIYEIQLHNSPHTRVGQERSVTPRHLLLNIEIVFKL